MANLSCSSRVKPYQVQPAECTHETTGLQASSAVQHHVVHHAVVTGCVMPQRPFIKMRWHWSFLHAARHHYIVRRAMSACRAIAAFIPELHILIA